VKKNGLADECQGEAPPDRNTKSPFEDGRIERASASEMRKVGLEPPRYCYRQPLKLADLISGCELMRILRADPQQK